MHLFLQVAGAWDIQNVLTTMAVYRASNLLQCCMLFRLQGLFSVILPTWPSMLHHGCCTDEGPAHSPSVVYEPTASPAAKRMLLRVSACTALADFTLRKQSVLSGRGTAHHRLGRPGQAG